MDCETDTTDFQNAVIRMLLVIISFLECLTPTGTITYAETKNSDHNLNIVLGACLLLGLANSSLAHLDELIRTIADLQDRLRPIPEN